MVQVDTTISKGLQITLPSAIRKEHNLQAGDTIHIVSTKDKITITKAETDAEKVTRIFRELDTWRDALPQKVKNNIKKRAGWTANQYREYFSNTPEHKAYIKEKYGL